MKYSLMTKELKHTIRHSETYLIDLDAHITDDDDSSEKSETIGEEENINTERKLIKSNENIKKGPTSNPSEIAKNIGKDLVRRPKSKSS